MHKHCGSAAGRTAGIEKQTDDNARNTITPRETTLATRVQNQVSLCTDLPQLPTGLNTQQEGKLHLDTDPRWDIWEL